MGVKECTINGTLYENKVRQAADVETSNPRFPVFSKATQIKWWVLFSYAHHNHKDGMSSDCANYIPTTTDNYGVAHSYVLLCTLVMYAHVYIYNTIHLTP